MHRVSGPLRTVCRSFPTQLQQNRPMIKIAGLGLVLIAARYAYKALQDKNSPLSTGLSSVMRDNNSQSEQQQHYQQYQQHNTPTLLRSGPSSSALIEAHNELHIRVDHLESKIDKLEGLYKKSQKEVLTGKSLLSDSKEAHLLNETREAVTSSSIMMKCQICNCNDISHVMVPCGEAITNITYIYMYLNTIICIHKDMYDNMCL